MDDFGLPQPPIIDELQLQRCRQAGDFVPILFEWYKFVGLLCNFFARIRSDSEGVREIPPLDYAVLVALINRCSRLMLANIALSHAGRFGETTAILDRCIFESAVKVNWLCDRGDPGSFRRLVLDGLKPDLELKSQILDNVSARGGGTLVIEKRMLETIEDQVSTAFTTEAEVAASPKLPDLAAMISVVGHGRLMYVVGQRLGSHHIHGNWPSLLRDYLEEHEGVLGPRDHDCPMQADQYVFVMRFVLDAMRSFIGFVTRTGSGRDAFILLLDGVQQEIDTLNAEVIGGDFEYVVRV